MRSTKDSQPEPWLRGTLAEIQPVLRAVLHALELAREDADRFCRSLTEAELNARPCGIAPVAFHLRHISRSVDRLLTYAEGRSLDDRQVAELKSELEEDANSDSVFEELHGALDRAAVRIQAFEAVNLTEPRTVGQKKLPSTVAGLLIHVADHTQRHVGQAVTTAKMLLAQRTL